MFHHLCQMEWEIHQHHLDYPNGDPQWIVFLIRVERSDVFTIILMVIWQLILHLLINLRKMCGVQHPRRMRVLMTTNLDTPDQ